MIFGQNSYSKFRIVNEIFNNGIFPIIKHAEQETPLRMVRFRHGESLSYSLALPDDYEVVDNLEAYKEQSKTVPLRDLQIIKENSTDFATDSAILEISYNHYILRQGAQMIVTPSAGEISKIYKTCTENISPILVYTFSEDFSPNVSVGNCLHSIKLLCVSNHNHFSILLTFLTYHKYI